MFGFVTLFSAGVAFAQEPDIEINIDETISVGDNKTDETDSFKEEIQVIDSLITDSDVETEIIELVEEVYVEVSGEPVKVETPVKFEDKLLENGSLNSTDSTGLQDAEKNEVESSKTEPDSTEETIKDSGRKIKVSSGANTDSGEKSVSMDTDTGVEKGINQNIESEGLLDVDTLEIGQEYTIDANTNSQTEDHEASSTVVSDSEVNQVTSGSCSSTGNQSVDASIIVMSMILVPIFFRRLQR